MAGSKSPGKATTHKAAKTLQNPKSPKAAKPAATKTLAKRVVATRTVKSAPKPGTVKKSAIRRAVATVKARRNSSTKRL